MTKMWEEAKILYVDLENKTTYVKTLDAETYRKYPGGSALGMYIMLKEMDPTIEPLSPENLLIFSVSPLTGFPVSGQSRMNVTAKSPLTGTAGDSQVGGYIGPQVKSNGYDAVVITGRSKSPVYIYIDNENVEIKNADKIWGTVTGDAEKLIAEDLGHDKFVSSIIGPAGENLVAYACIMHQRSRANGRNGLGAVMGSKNVKALVLKKQGGRSPANRETLKDWTKNTKKRLEKLARITYRGTSGNLEVLGAQGVLPSYNWDLGVMPDYEKIRGEQLTENNLVSRATCHGCGVRCKREISIPGKADPEYGGPEYETMATFGSYCGNKDIGLLCHANQLCNMYGLDTVSCGATIAWAMDAFEKGMLTTDDTDGLELNFGRGDLFAELIKKIAYKQPGIGDLLAKGSAEAAGIIGKGSEDLVVASKKQEWPGHMVQFKPSLAIIYSVGNFGADHQSSEHDPSLMGPKDGEAWNWINKIENFEHVDGLGILDDNKAKLAFVSQKYYSMMETLCLCQFAWGLSWQLYGPEDLLIFCKGTIDWDTSYEELLEIGERRINMMRMFNAANGFGRQDDKLPKKAFLPLTIPDGTTLQIKEDEFENAIDSYYSYAGWDVETGIPKKETLDRLGLSWINEQRDCLS